MWNVCNFSYAIVLWCYYSSGKSSRKVWKLKPNQCVCIVSWNSRWRMYRAISLTLCCNINTAFCISTYDVRTWSGWDGCVKTTDTSSTYLALYSGTHNMQCIPSGYGAMLLSYIPSTNVFLKTIQAWVVPPTAFSRENVYTVVCCSVTPYICVSTFSINTISTASFQKRL